jgi:hypothetical protein
VEGATTGGPGGALINKPLGTIVDRTLHLLPTVAITARDTASLPPRTRLRLLPSFPNPPPSLAGRAQAMPFTPCSAAHARQNPSDI